MINDHVILQSHLIYFRKTCYIVRNLKKKSKFSPPKPSIQIHPKRIYIGDEYNDTFPLNLERSF